MGLTNEPPDLLPGTLDLLILRTLVAGPAPGYGIAERLKILSQDVLQVGERSLYPALQRLLLTAWVKGEGGVSENNRRARYYTLTAAGRKHLGAEMLAARGGERVIAGAPVVLGDAPFALDPGGEQQPLQRRIERALADLQHVLRQDFQPLGDAVARRRAGDERPQDEQIERARQQIGRL